jgi:hypothetical protein
LKSRERQRGEERRGEGEREGERGRERRGGHAWMVSTDVLMSREGDR